MKRKIQAIMKLFVERRSVCHSAEGPAALLEVQHFAFCFFIIEFTLEKEARHKTTENNYVNRLT